MYIFFLYSGVFRVVSGYSGMFQGIPGCSGLFLDVPGCSGVFRGVPGVFRGVPGCSGVFRDVPGCSLVYRGVPGCFEVFRSSGVPGIPGCSTCLILVVVRRYQIPLYRDIYVRNKLPSARKHSRKQSREFVLRSAKFQNVR